MLISGLLTAILLVLFAFKVKDEKGKNLILKFSAISTVLIHYSDIWVNFFATGGDTPVLSVHILPVYPCNVMMWLLLALVCVKKESVAFRILAESCFYIGTICGIVGIVLNANFDATPTLADYEVLKGLLSHSTMLFGCIYLKVAGYIKTGVFNALSCAIGLLTFVLCGVLVNELYTYFGMEVPDGMFLKSNPYLSVSPIVLGAGLLLVMLLALALYEQVSFPKEERWYTKLKNILNEDENTRKERL